MKFFQTFLRVLGRQRRCHKFIDEKKKIDFINCRKLLILFEGEICFIFSEMQVKI